MKLISYYQCLKEVFIITNYESLGFFNNGSVIQNRKFGMKPSCQSRVNINKYYLSRNREHKFPKTINQITSEIFFKNNWVVTYDIATLVIPCI